MCRLFGLSAAPRRVTATFWLLEAPDSLARQSRRDPNGTGLGTFTERGEPQVDKQALPAYADQEFVQRARQCASTTFLAHVRYASTGDVLPRNTHPFAQCGRLFAHNGVIGGLPRLEAELGDYLDLVSGDSDSERLFALITRYIDRYGGDVTSGLTAAVRWVAAQLPLYSLNLVLTTPTDLWALRYPDDHRLFVLDRAAGGASGARHLEQASPAGRIRTRSGQLATCPAVVVASERMDEDPGWQELRSGELVHVDGRLAVSRRIIVEHRPRYPLSLGELATSAAASQAED